MLEGANRNSVTRYESSLQQVASAFRIAGEQWNIVDLIKHWNSLIHSGFIRFLEGYYIILITKRKS